MKFLLKSITSFVLKSVSPFFDSTSIHMLEDISDYELSNASMASEIFIP